MITTGVDLRPLPNTQETMTADMVSNARSVGFR